MWYGKFYDFDEFLVVRDWSMMMYSLLIGEEI